MKKNKKYRHLAHSDGHATEHEALDKISGQIENIKDQIVFEMEQLGEYGLAPHEFADIHGLLILTVRNRFNDLWKEGRIKKNGLVRKNGNGNNSIVWIVGRDPNLKEKVKCPHCNGKGHTLETRS